MVSPWKQHFITEISVTGRAAIPTIRSTNISSWWPLKWLKMNLKCWRRTYRNPRESAVHLVLYLTTTQIPSKSEETFAFELLYTKGTEKVMNLIELNTFILIIETADKAQFRRLLKMIESVICIVFYPLFSYLPQKNKRNLLLEGTWQ